MTKFRTALVGTGVLALVAATLTPLSADRAGAAPSAAPGVVLQATSTPSAEEIEALDQAAAKSDETPWVVDFSYAIDRVKEAFPDDFGAAEVHEDQASGWIAFEGAVPDNAEEVVADLPGVELRGDLGMSEKDISRSVDLIFESLLQTYGSKLSVTVVPRPGDQEIVVEYAQSESARTSADSIEESMLSATKAIELGGFALRAEAVSEGVKEEILLHGARVLAGGCTGGFPVKHKYGPELGIFTAGHCPGTGSYDGVADAFYAPVNYSLSTTTGSGGGDFRWNHSKYGLSGQTFVGHGKPLRVFNSHANPAVGQTICKYGKTTDYGCSIVAECGAVGSAPVHDTGQTYPVGGLCRTQQQITAGGDSGGPWFYGNTAYGIHHGSNSTGSFFSLVRNALSKTRVNLVVDSAGNTIP